MTEEQLKEAVEELLDINKELEGFLTERISDLHNVKGGMQGRHAYILYRKLVNDQCNILTKMVSK